MKTYNIENSLSSEQCISDPLVSVIIPVYNVAPYLKECLDSVITQSYNKLEIIIIDDGSTDGSGSICDEYKRDQRVVIIHQKNRGLSNARNVGLELMTGDYLAFLDSDDYLHPDYIKKMLNCAISKMSDIVVCKFMFFHTDEKVKQGKIEKTGPALQSGWYTSKEMLQALVEKRLNPAVWNKLYKREVWDNLRFTEGYYYEDLEAMCRVLVLCGSIYIIEETLYFYRTRNDSISKTISVKNITDRIKAYKQLERFIEANIPIVYSQNHLQESYQERLLYMIVQYADLLPTGNREFTKELGDEIINLGRSIESTSCPVLTKIAYRMFLFCPWLLKKTYAAYHQIRLLARKVSNKRSL